MPAKPNGGSSTPRADRDKNIELRDRIIDYGEKAFIVLFYAGLLVRLWPRLSIQPQTLLILLSEVLVVLFILVRRPGECASSPYALIIAFVGSSAPMMIYGGGQSLLPDALASTIMIAGQLLNIWSKLTLRRSFGAIAANRGVKTAGPYRFVRHPMYLGYITAQAAYLVTNLNWWNVMVYAVAWTTQLLRIREEERLLSSDPAYQSFMEKVPSRLVPGLY